MNILARPATAGRWLDTDVPLTDAVCAEIAAQGYVGVFRYLPLPGDVAAGDLTAAELRRILGQGLECGAVQHVRGQPPKRPLWRPADHDGAADGAFAAHYARAVAGLPGVHLFQDLEAVDGVDAEAWAYSAAWAAAVVRPAGTDAYQAGLYVGYAQPLSAARLYALPHDRYWSDCGPRDVMTRGFCVKQKQGTIRIGGVAFDVDIVAPDALGGLPMIAAIGHEGSGPDGGPLVA